MRKLSITVAIWAIFFAALTVSVSLTYHWYKQRGPVIKISFEDGDDLVPDQSRIIYRGVQVGKIKTIEYEPTTNKVVIAARITKQAEKFLGKDSKFWIVKPQVGFEKISNLSTLATGDYIAVEPIKGPFAKEFNGLEKPPTVTELSDGLRLYLEINELQGISPDSPILYHGLQIGEIAEMGLTANKRAIKITVFIYPQYASVVRRSSYFANVSGVHANIHLFGGSHVDLDSLRTVMRGGIAVHTANLSAEAAKNGDVFGVLTAAQVLSDD